MLYAYKRNIKIIYGKTKCGKYVLLDNGYCRCLLEVRITAGYVHKHFDFETFFNNKL